MAQYDNAKRILRNEEARIASSATGIYDQNLLILFWQNIEPKYISECVDYLNHADQAIVSAPVTYADVPFTDDLYHLHAYYDESDQSIYRLLMHNTIAYFADNWDQTTTKWKLATGETYASGQSNVVLTMPNVNPAYALEFQEQGLEESYTDEIYLLRDVVLEGEWFNVKREAAEDPRTGLYTLRWYLSKYLNNEVGFIYKDTFGSVVTEVNLVEANFSIIQEFMARTRVDTDGNWYHDTGAGTHYDRINGNDETEGFKLIVSGSTNPLADGNYNLISGDGTQGDADTKFLSSGGWYLVPGTRAGNTVFILYNSADAEAANIAATANQFPWEVSIAYMFNPLSGATIVGGLIYPVTVYALDDPQSGRSVRARSYYDEREKNWNIQFLIRQIDNENDYIFTYMDTSKQRTADFFKLNMPTSGIAEFLTDYFFDSDGNYYYADDKTTYTEKNGATATPALVSSVPAYTLGEVVSGRVVQMSESPDDNMDTVTIRAQITWASDVDESGIIYRMNNNAISTEIELNSVSETRRDNFIAYTYTDLDGNWYYAASAPAYTSMNGTAATGTLPTSATKLEDSMDARSLQVQLSYIDSKDRWNVKVTSVIGVEDARISYLSGDNRLVLNTSPDTALFMDKSINVTHAQMLLAETYYGGTTPCPAGTVRRINVTPKPDGFYDYDAIEITTTGVTATFKVGKKTTYFGFHYPLLPTSDTAAGGGGFAEDSSGNWVNATHILIGGTAAAATDIGPTTDITNSIRYEEDGTWSWNIETETTQEEITYGDPDGAGSASDILFKYGTPKDEMHWVGRRLFEELPGAGGVIDLVGEYVTITEGTATGLTGRSMVIGELRGQQLEDGKLSYDVYERHITADLNSNDDWFMMGVVEAAEREKKILNSMVIGANGNPYPAPGSYATMYADALQLVTNAHPALDGFDYSGVTGLDANENPDLLPIYAKLESATMRRKTILRERKYFVRRPTTTDLDNTEDSPGVSLSTAMGLTHNVDGAPDTLEVKTYNILKLGENLFAIERLTVKLGADIYRDDNGFERLVDANGKSVFGIATMPIHNGSDGSSGGTFLDITES